MECSALTGVGITSLFTKIAEVGIVSHNQRNSLWDERPNWMKKSDKTRKKKCIIL